MWHRWVADAELIGGTAFVSHFCLPTAGLPALVVLGMAVSHRAQVLQSIAEDQLLQNMNEPLYTFL